MSSTEGTNTTGIYELSDIGITSTDIPPSEGTLNLTDIAYQSNANVFNGINTFNSDILLNSNITLASTSLPASGQLGSLIVGSVITNGTLFTSGTPLSISNVTITPGVWILLGQVVFTIASVSTSPVLIGHAISLGQSNTAMALLCSNEDIVSETVALSNVISKQVTRILAVNGTYTYNLMALNTFSNCTISVNAAASNLTALRIG
jgi:hypothetical protein